MVLSSEQVMLFPLKLNVFERYMLADDRPTSPMSFFVRVLFSGAFDKAAFVAALEAALQRHPLLHARLTGRRAGDLAWVASPKLLPWFDLSNEGVPMLFPSGFRLDLRRENGLRVWIRHGDDRGEIRFQFHHACCDGVAANQFIADVLCAYDWKQRGLADGAPAFRPLDVETLRRRDRLGARQQNRLLRGLVAAWGALVRLPHFFLTRPTPLHAPGDANGDGTDVHDTLVPDLLTWRFDTTQLDNLLVTAKESGVTLNDLMIRDFFLAMRAWNNHHSGGRGTFLRILIPFNLRGPEHDRLPVTNVMGMINIDRRFEQLARSNPEALLDGIRSETRFLKRSRLPAAFIHAMAVSEKAMGSLERIFRTDRCLTTAVLSNLGRIFTDTPLRRHGGKLLAGGLVVEAVDTAPPVRTGSGISCTLYTYASQMSLTLLYDRRCFSSTVAVQLLKRLVAQIERTVNCTAKETAAALIDAKAGS
ncbi:MAG: hypothetical protein HZC54_04215 [Verrucomicrobia bacterium]|nr:hypothetical protein [Verrucomicrobiota bacterium]